MATLQVRLDDKLKKDADALFSGFGMDTSTAVRIFLSMSLENQGLPFELRRHRSPVEKNISPVYGSAKGKLWIAEDFDAPLDELKEYME